MRSLQISSLSSRLKPDPTSLDHLIPIAHHSKNTKSSSLHQLLPTIHTIHRPATRPANMNNSQDSGVTGAAKFVTSTVGNTAGGVGRTAGNVVGAAGRGLGDTITSATGSAGKPVGDALGSVGTGVQNGADSLSKGVENAGQWKK
ncbi:hypothetical protein F5Y06DRAFT_11422 [Hypoxylon sp. FL0890]|nr:hypothetical protein F5Y06DRAFT_11422 [Hypoxylon sp. FL0890]